MRAEAAAVDLRPHSLDFLTSERLGWPEALRSKGSGDGTHPPPLLPSLSARCLTFRFPRPAVMLRTVFGSCITPSMASRLAQQQTQLIDSCSHCRAGCSCGLIGASRRSLWASQMSDELQRFQRSTAQHGCRAL